MSIIAAALKHMLAAGMPHDEIVSAVAEMEAAAAPVKSARQERNARYYQNSKRLKSSESKADKTVSDVSDAIKTVSDAEPPRTCAQVVNPSLPSLRSEEVKNSTHSSSAALKRPKSARSRFVPDDWAPSAALQADLAARGFNPGEIERELTKFRDHEFRDPHSDWVRAFRKWMNNSRQFAPRREPHERPHTNSKFDAKQANLARAFAAPSQPAGQRWEP
jgi:hypothetical protein